MSLQREYELGTHIGGEVGGERELCKAQKLTYFQELASRHFKGFCFQKTLTLPHENGTSIASEIRYTKSWVTKKKNQKKSVLGNSWLRISSI